MTIRIAMWSGPRNISTAMMRAFEHRQDTCVVDEPFYAYYLRTTGIDHPMGELVIQSQPGNWKSIAEHLSTRDCEQEIYYQKHMTHHMLDEVDLDWTRGLVNCFLIRHPKYVVNSYSKKRASISEDDIGIKRQYELYKEISDLSAQDIPVIDARLFLQAPEASLRKLCEQIGITFTDDMLSWPPGRRDSDGVWASHWYEAVEKSTGFQPFEEPEIDLSPEYQAVVDEAQEYYDLLLAKC